MFGRILAGVLVPVAIAASGYGGFVAMNEVIDKVEAQPGDETAWSPDASFIASTSKMQITLPYAFTADVLQQTVDGVVLEATIFNSREDLAEGYGVVVLDFAQLAVGVDPQSLLQRWLATSVIEGYQLVGDEAFVLGADPARRARAHGDDGDMYFTLVLHGTVGVVVIGITSDGDSAPADYASVVASLKFTLP